MYDDTTLLEYVKISPGGDITRSEGKKNYQLKFEYSIILSWKELYIASYNSNSKYYNRREDYKGSNCGKENSHSSATLDQGRLVFWCSFSEILSRTLGSLSSNSFPMECRNHHLDHLLSGQAALLSFFSQLNQNQSHNLDLASWK